MKPILLLTLALMLGGCTQRRYVTCYGPGWMVEEKDDGKFETWHVACHCQPCSEAESPEALFVCFGKTTKPSPTPTYTVEAK